MKHLLFLLLLLSGLSSETFIKEYTYQATDSDSKLSARKAALAHIKMLVIEESGVVVKSSFTKNTSIKNGKVDKTLESKLSSLSQAVIKTIILKEKWNGETFYLKASVSVDNSKFLQAMQALNKVDPKVLCQEHKVHARKMLEDLSTQESIETVVSFATKYPYTTCDNWHGYIMQVFSNQNITHLGYRAFLVKQLLLIKDPSSNNISNYIISFLAKDLSHEEYQAVLKSMSRMSQLGTTLNKIYYKNKDIFSRLVKDLFTLNDKHAFSQKTMTNYHILATLSYYLNDADYLHYYYKYEKSFTEKQRDNFIKDLSRIYRTSDDKRLFHTLVNYYNKQKYDRGSFDSYWKFVTSRASQDKAYKTVNFIHATQAWMEKSFSLYPHKYMLERYRTFMLKYGIHSTHTPTAKSIATKLKQKLDNYKLLEQLHYLEALGDEAIKSNELQLITLLQNKNFSSKNKHIVKLFSLLERIHSKNPKLIPVLLKAMTHSRGSSTSYTKQVKQMLINMGGMVSEPLRQRYLKLNNHRDNTQQQNIIEILATHKSQAKENIEFLKSITPLYPQVKKAKTKAIRALLG